MGQILLSRKSLKFSNFTTDSDWNKCSVLSKELSINLMCSLKLDSQKYLCFRGKLGMAYCLLFPPLTDTFD